MVGVALNGAFIHRGFVMPTNRTRTRRQAYLAISPDSIELYRRAKHLQAKGFADSLEYHELAFKLHIELRVKPWMPSLLHPIGNEPPSEIPKKLQHFWFTARDLQRSLDAAVARITTPLPRSERVVAFPQQPAP
jgi:hypothetical protein